MRRFRKRRSLGSLALFALVLQFALSFGHYHNHPGEHHDTTASKSFFCEQWSSAKCGAPDDDDDENHCSICMTMALARSLVLSEPLAIRIPQIPTNGFKPQRHTDSLPYAVIAQFRARDPPLV